MMTEKYTRFLFFTTFVILLNSSSCKKDSANNVCIKKKYQMLPFPCDGLFPSKVEWERKIGITNMTYPNGDSLVLKSYYILQ